MLEPTTAVRDCGSSSHNHHTYSLFQVIVSSSYSLDVEDSKSQVPGRRFLVDISVKFNHIATVFSILLTTTQQDMRWFLHDAVRRTHHAVSSPRYGDVIVVCRLFSVPIPSVRGMNYACTIV